MRNIIIVAICGGSASGKTALSKELSRRNSKDILLVSQDEYYKSFDEYTIEEKRSINYDHPDAFDIELLVENLTRLKNGESVESPIYSFNEYARTGTQTVAGKPIILLEGMLTLYYPELRQIIDKKIYIDCPEEIRLQRMIERDVAERGRTPEWVVEQYNRDMKPMHDKFVEPQKQFADTVLDGSKPKDIVYKSVERFLERCNVLEDYER